MRQAATKQLLALFEKLLLAIFLASIATLFVQKDWLWRWDNLLYDTQLGFWNRPANDDIVIIAIDDYSLSKIGRWPWPRSTHAKLIDILTKESPAAIGLDIILSEPESEHPAHDKQLAEAMRNNGHVVLPVYITKHRQKDYPIEVLPIPSLTEQAAGLGHVHIDISDDGIARQVYLYEGLGDTGWPHFSLALLNAAGKPALPEQDDSTGKQHATPDSFMKLTHKQPFLIPYAGPPGLFKRIAYQQVINGQFPHGFFHNKYVLVGATAEGLGDVLPSPFSGHSKAMSGVEINANILDARLQQINLTALNKNFGTILTLILSLLPIIVFQFLKPRSALLALLIILAGTIGLSAFMLWSYQLWYSPAVALLLQIISYPLWSWRRLEQAVRHLNHELDDLNQQRKKLSIYRRTNVRRSIHFLRTFLPINGWVMIDEDNTVIQHDGQRPTRSKQVALTLGWHYDSYSAWTSLRYNNRDCRLGLSFEMDALINDQEKQLLNQLLFNLQESEQDSCTPTDFLDAKIQQIQLAETNLHKLRRFIDDGLSNMADGVIVCDACGEILLSNARASWYLTGNDNTRLGNLSVNTILKDMRLPGNVSWKPLLHKSLLLQQRVITQAEHKSGRDLMVQISPLNLIENMAGGLVINLSDIRLLKASEKKRDELLNFLSHDLRSPLSATLAQLELIKNVQDMNEVKKSLETVTSLTHKTLHLAEQFLHLSRAKSSEDLPLYDIDFNTIVLNAIEQLWTMAKAKNIRVQKTFSQEELWIMGEPDLLERALVNLISNAIKYSEEKTTVKIHVFTEKKNIHCCITDEGYGIPEEDLPNLFELFKRVHRDGNKQKLGIGLGLAFVDAVAKRHGGHINVESTAGLGSSFCLIIPFQQAINRPTQDSQILS